MFKLWYDIQSSLQVSKNITVRFEYEEYSRITIGPVSESRFFETKYTEVDLHLHDSKILGE
jgi:hypothetical protein